MEASEAPIVNRVQNSGIVTLDLEEYYFAGPRFGLDIAPWLWQGLVLKEQDFRDAVAAHDWAQYQGGAVAVYCSEPDALIQTWAWMLVGNRVAQAGAQVVIGSEAERDAELFRRALAAIDVAALAGARVVLKGCSKHPVPAAAYGELAARLTPVVQSLMFGEACSAVPIYKRKKT